MGLTGRRSSAGGRRGSAVRRRGALPDNELGRELDPGLRRLLPVCQPQDEPCGSHRHLDKRLPHRRQRWTDPGCDGQVVEADDAEILGDVETELAGGLVDPEGLEIVAGEDRRWGIGQGQKRAALGRPLVYVEASTAESGPGSIGTPASSIAAR